MQLPEMHYRVLARLAGASRSDASPRALPAEAEKGQKAALPAGADGGHWVEMNALAAELGVDQSPVAAACTLLAEQGLVQIHEQPFDEFRLDKDGQPYATAPLPERVIAEVLVKQGGRCRIGDIPNHCSLSASSVGQTLRWLAQRGWAKKEGELLVLSEAGKTAGAGAPLPALSPQTGRGGDARRGAVEPDEALIRALAGGNALRSDELAAQGVPVQAAMTLLKGRKGLVVVKQRIARQVAISEAGRKLLAAGVTTRKAVTQLTPDLLSDGAWRNVDLQPYDVTLSAKRLFCGKEHAFQRTLDRVRRVFLEMGFEEIASPWVESSYWDFDALFQPQDHPARDMQDTFYVAKPGRSKLPDAALVERTRATHENGGDTGSTGWQYRWSRDMAAKPVLRTHTTAATIRALARHKPGTAGKYFIVGPVFRRETVDYKHLPIFHQVDGIIVDPHASLATLLGTLAAFYSKMGFPKVRFCPSFFPYTEPSVEALIYMESRKEWVEMGGSGIFRPEVTLPLGISDRVLAWGLGLERVAMMAHNLSSIGELYFATMPWLREAPLCR